MINLYLDQGVQDSSSEGGVELGSVGPSIGNESEMPIHEPGSSTIGTAYSNASEINRPLSKLRIDPARGPPPAFLPSNTAAQKISVSSYQVNTATTSQYMHLASYGPPNMGPQPIDFEGYNGPLVTAPTPRRSVSQTVYDVSPAVANHFSAIQSSSGPIAPIRLQPQKRVWPSSHMAQISPDGAKPSLEVAFDPQNLPFMELGRRSAAVDHGVVRISNASISIGCHIKNFNSANIT
jgi:hypothetical protein